MRKYFPLKFTEVALDGQFWKERLETVLTRTVPSQHLQLGVHGILASLSPKAIWSNAAAKGLSTTIRARSPLGSVVDSAR